jgi:hypothetical protein
VKIEGKDFKVYVNDVEIHPTMVEMEVCDKNYIPITYSKSFSGTLTGGIEFKTPELSNKLRHIFNGIRMGGKLI